LVIYDDGFNYLTKMCLTVMREACFRMIALGKEHGCTVIVCSSDATDHYTEYLLGCRLHYSGEGELTLVEPIDTLDKMNRQQFLPELSTKTIGRIGTNSSQSQTRGVAASDQLPMPAGIW
jgi:anaerobic magnesium-protoporphyrin IX monomethyl ester cyclase